MKIYTRGGDDGTSGLFGGERVSKSHDRLECYGTIDELNAALGLAGAAADDAISTLLAQIQSELFVVGGSLATPDVTRAAKLPQLHPSATARLESEIDSAEAQLPPLTNFILPGGSECAARLHVARTICRRGERIIVALSQREPIAPPLLAYVNRLSDWLFVHARLANKKANVPDRIWTR